MTAMSGGGGGSSSGFTGTTLLLCDVGGAGQAIPNATGTTVTDWGVTTDNTGTFASGIYTAPTAGHYLINCQITFGADDNAAGFKAMFITKNGTATVILRGTTSDGVTLIASKQLNGVVKLAANDTVRVRVFCTNTLSCSTTAGDMNLAIYRVA